MFCYLRLRPELSLLKDLWPNWKRPLMTLKVKWFCFFSVFSYTSFKCAIYQQEATWELLFVQWSQITLFLKAEKGEFVFIPDVSHHLKWAFKWTVAIIWGIYQAMTSRQSGIFESTSRQHLMNTLFHVSMTNSVLSAKVKHFPFLLSSTPCCPPAVGAAVNAAVGAAVGVAIAVEIGAHSFTLFWFGLHIGDLNLTLSSTSSASLRSICSCGVNKVRCATDVILYQLSWNHRTQSRPGKITIAFLLFWKFYQLQFSG